MSREDVRREVQAEVLALEAGVEASILDALDRQERVVLARLTGTKARRHTRHWDPPGERKIDPKYVLALDRWKQEVSSALATPLRRAAQAARARVARSIGLSVEALPPIPEQQPGATQRIVDWLTARFLEIQEVIAREESLGASISQIEMAVQEAYAEKAEWAKRVAADETVGVYNEAALRQAEASGRVLRKQWLSSRDDRVRTTHADADGQTRLIGEPFSVGAARLDFPGDPTGPAGEVKNCRCTMLFEVANRWKSVEKRENERKDGIMPTKKEQSGADWLYAQYAKLGVDRATIAQGADEGEDADG